MATELPPDLPPDLRLLEEVADLDPFLMDQSFASMIHTLADCTLYLEDTEAGQAMLAEQMILDLPIELYADVDETGNVSLRSSPPTQRTETTFLPVFHRLKVRIGREFIEPDWLTTNDPFPPFQTSFDSVVSDTPDQPLPTVTEDGK